MTVQPMKILAAICLSFILLIPAVTFGDSDPESDRIKAISQGLEKENPKVKAWQYGWASAYGIMSATYTGVALKNRGIDINEKQSRHDAIVNASTSFLAFGNMLFDPLTAGSDTTVLKTMPETTPEERKIKLKKAEDLLIARAEREEKGRSWQTHALSLLVNTISSVIIATDGKRTEDGLINFASGMLVSEIQIFTTPNTSAKAWEAYKKGKADPYAETDLRPSFQITAIRQGIAVTYWF